MDSHHSSRLAQCGRLIARHSKWVLALWALLVVASVPLAARLPTLLAASTPHVPDSQAIEVRRLLDTDFTNPFVEPTVVVLRSEVLSVEDPAFREGVRDMATALRARPEVARVAALTDPAADPRLASSDGHTTFLLVGTRGRGAEAVKAVAAVREAVAPATDRLKARDPGMIVATSGAIALQKDTVQRSTLDGQRAEKLVALPALLVLLLVFASPLAALLPVVVGVAASSVALGASALFTGLLPLSSFITTTITMLGLALGIDYSLLVVSRFREFLREEATPEDAASGTLATAGWTVLTSGLVVLVSLCVLIPIGITDTVSVGLGGALVVIAAVALSTTLLPALLTVLAAWLDWPKRFTRPLLDDRWRNRWEAWGRLLTRHKWPAVAASLLVLAAMIYPVTWYRVGVPGINAYPQQLEAVQGSQLLASMNRQGLTFPVLVVVRSREPASVLRPAGVRKMLRLSGRLHQDARVRDVLGPVDLRPGLTRLHYAALYANPDRALKRYPEIQELFISRDRRLAAFQVLPKERVTLAEGKALVRELRAMSDPDFEVMVGGLPALNLDFQTRLYGHMPWAVGAVFLLTGLFLFVAFRSVLVPLKAIALNLLAVSAAIGMVVLVFQEGHGASWLGMSAGLGELPLMMPFLIFCLTFGLSMDYELFMISRIREERAGPGTEDAAIARGLSATGGVVTAAGSLMVLVFAAFATADMVFVKMFGFGLGMAIAVEATLIRGILAPALLSIAGRWNWWPGDGNFR